MKVTTSLPTHDLNAVDAAAKQVEKNGFDGVTTQENRHDAYLPLAVAATNTQSLELRTSIAIAFNRSPMSAAMVAWDLQAASGGRFSLGLGSQVKGHNVRRFSVPWSAPAPRMREYVESIRAIWQCWMTGEQLNYQGDHYQFSLMTPNFTPEPLSCAPPRILIAAVGPHMMRVAGSVCDGVLLHPFCTRRYIENAVMPTLDKALDKRGKCRAEFEISGGGFVATGEDDESVEKMFEWVRQRIGFYGSTPSYWPVFEAHDLKDLGLKLNEMSKQGQWQEMTKEITDDIVHLFAAVGRYDEIAVAIEKRFGGLVDVVSCEPQMPKQVIQDIQKITG